MAAARTAQQAGATVLLIDLADQPGGALAAMGLDIWQRHHKAEIADQDTSTPTWNLGDWPVSGIDTLFRTALTRIAGDTLILHGPQGTHHIQANILVLATGGRETTRGNLAIPGSRPAGVLTAGAALRLMATTGYLPGKRAVVAGSGRWAGIVAEALDAAGVQVGVITPKVLQIDGWPRLTHVVLASGGRSACDLLVLAGDVQPWESLNLRGAGIQILFAGSMALGECTAAEAANDGASVGSSAASIVLGR